MKISLVILNFNGLKETTECLDSVSNLNKKKLTINTIVVDNASTDLSIRELRKKKDIDLLENRENLGYSGGNNIGVKHALKQKPDYICVLNNDVKLERNLIIHLVESAGNDIISPKIYFYPGFEFHKSRYQKKELGKVIWSAGCFIDWENVIGQHRGVDDVDHGQYDKKIEIDYATGACIFASRGVFERVGLFDEKYFLYLEDMDFSIRAKRKGYRILYQPKAVMWHKNATSSGGSGSKLQDYYITRNRLYFAFKYAKPRTKMAVLKQTIQQVSDPVKRSALIDFLIFRMGRCPIEIK